MINTQWYFEILQTKLANTGFMNAYMELLCINERKHQKWIAIVYDIIRRHSYQMVWIKIPTPNIWELHERSYLIFVLRLIFEMIIREPITKSCEKV